MSASDIGFQRPGLPELLGRAADELNLAVPGGEAHLRWTNLGVLAAVIAGASHEMHSHLEAIAAAVLPDRATGRMLDRHAAWRGIDRHAPQAATGEVRFIGGNPSALIAPGLTLRGPNKMLYHVVEPGGEVGADGVAVVAVVAQEPGPRGNLPGGTVLHWVSPVAGLAASGMVAEIGLGGGIDGEGDEDLRARLAEHVRQPPQGGAAHDYVFWAKTLPGVTRAWAVRADPHSALIHVRFMMDGLYADGLPQPADVARMQEILDIERPLAALPVALAPIARVVPLTIRDLNPTSAEIRAAVLGEVQDLFRFTTAPGKRLPVSHLREAISRALGEYDHVLVTPAADIQPEVGEIPTLGAVTWQTS